MQNTHLIGMSALFGPTLILKRRPPPSSSSFSQLLKSLESSTSVLAQQYPAPGHGFYSKQTWP